MVMPEQRVNSAFPGAGSCEPEPIVRLVKADVTKEPAPLPLIEDEDAGSFVVRQPGALDRVNVQSTVATQVTTEPEVSLSVSHDELTLKGPAEFMRPIILPVLGLGVFGILAAAPFSPVTAIVGGGVVVIILVDMYYLHRPKR
jgi:hypothetical protein